MRAAFLSLLFLTVLLGAVAGGLAMSPFLAARLHVAPFRVKMVRGDAVPETLSQLVGASRSEVLLASDFIDNLTVLQAVEDAFKRGVTVTIVMPLKDRNQNALRWLSDRKIPYRTSRVPFRGSVIVVDGVYAAESPAPLLSRSDLAKEQVALTVFQHRPTSSQFTELVNGYCQN